MSIAPSAASAPSRIFLSPPHMGDEEVALVQEAFASNWIAPLGPHVDAFEREMGDYLGIENAAALSSGTAALHLALRLLGVKAGDEVICSTFTFSASANPIVYENARPLFIDSDFATWNMDPELLRAALRDRAASGKLPAAAIIVDLYGQCADYDAIISMCAEYGVPVIEDAAEALGATYHGKMAGTFGKCAAFSFNGNKIITTSGGGMLVSDDRQLIERTRFLATQARDPAPHYQHSHVGYNYRLSNVLAAIGRGQLRVLPDRIAARKRAREFYQDRLGQLDGLAFMPIAPYGESNYWLTCITIDPEKFGATNDDLRSAFEQENIEVRPVWKPLHLQPIFSGCDVIGGEVSASIFATGLCLPSGSSLTPDDLDRIVSVIVGFQRSL